MKKLIALVLCIILAFSVPLCANAVNGENTQFVDLLSTYTTKQVVEMYPEASQHLADEFRKLNNDISLRDYNIDIRYIDSLYLSVLIENPDIFYVNPHLFESTIPDDSNYLISVRPVYLFDTETIKNEIKTFESECDAILKSVDDSWSDLVKIRYLHDKIATSCEYDMDLYNENKIIYTAYGALVNRDAVCEGYTLAFMYLLDKLGIENHYVISRKMEHAWALVKLKGKYYHVDITHDDPSYDNLGRVNHEFFLKSDKAYASDGNHHDWISEYKASDTTYDNMWWNKINTFIFNIDGKDYYVDQLYGSSIYGAIMERNANNNLHMIAKITERWMHKDMENSAFWERSFVYLAYDGEYLYYNDTSNIYRQKPSSTRAEVIYEKPSSLDDIYGLAFRTDGSLYITIKRYPDTSDTIYRLANLEPIRWVDALPADDVTNPGGSSGDNSDTPIAPTDPSSANKNDPSQSGHAIVKKHVERKTLYVNQTGKITVVDKTATFKSSDKSIVTVSKKGKMTAKKKGKATITVKGDSIHLKVKVTVKNPKLKVTTKTIKKGKAYNIIVLNRYGAATYTSSNPSVATVTANGKIKAQKKGKANIKIKIGTAKLKLKVTVTN